MTDKATRLAPAHLVSADWGGHRTGAGAPTKRLMFRHLDGTPFSKEEVRAICAAMERFGARRTRERRTRENRDRTESQLAQPSDFDIPGPKIHVDYSPLKKEQL